MAAARPLRLLIVEDHQHLGNALRRVLSARGHVTELCRSAAQARAACASAGPARAFECGIFDVGLPDADGVELARELLALGVVHAAVFFSAGQDDLVRARAGVLGPFVDKHEGVEALEAALASVTASTPQPSSVGRSAC